MKKREKKVWDILTRIFHWSLVAAFAVAFITSEGDDRLHTSFGYIVIGLIVFRLLWGFIGSKHSRFSDFLYGPAKIIGYLKGIATGRPVHYTGHNPAGGAMIIVMLITLSLLCFSGLKVWGTEGEGLLAGVDTSIVSVAHADDDSHEYGERGESAERGERASYAGASSADGDGGGNGAGHEFWEETHEFFADLMIFFIFTHIAGVLISSYIHKENLVKSMITGRKEVGGA